MMNKDMLNHAHHVSENELYDAYKIFFGTLVSESRLRIMNLLLEGKKNVSDIMRKLKMDQTSVSHNLARLKRCGFVSSQVVGKYRYYKINDDTIKPLMGMIEKHMGQYCVHILHYLNGEHEHGK